MKTIIIYQGKYTTVDKCIDYLKKGIENDITSMNVNEIKEKNININEYDCIIVGGSLHYGKIQKEVNEFVINNEQILKEKKLGFFICSGDRREKNLEESFGQLVKNAAATSMFGGEYDFSAMNLVDKILMKMLFGGKNKPQPKIHYDELDKFIENIKK